MATPIADEYADIAKRLAEIKAERRAELVRPETTQHPNVNVDISWTPGGGMEDYG